MSERDALLRHILEHPDDDHARLVFADWLDEHGEADRAHFIRLQIARENDPARGPIRHPYTGKYPPNEAEMLARHREDWVLDLPEMWWMACSFRRGFIEDVAVNVETFLAEPEAIWRRCPILGLDLDGDEPYSPPLEVPRKQLGQLRRLSFSNVSFTTRTLVSILAEIPPGRLRELALISCPIDVKSLVECEFVRGLRELYLDQVELGIEGMRALAAVSFETGLEELFIADCEPVAELARILAETPGFASLRRLTVWNAELWDAGARELADSPYLGGLVHLDVRYNDLDDDGWDALRARFGDRVVTENSEETPS